MRDLQISLLVIGAFVVAGVYLFNLLQERRFRRRTEQAFPHEHEDVLLQGAAARSGTVEGRVEPRVQLDPVIAPAVVRAASRAPAPVVIDPVIDYVVEVRTPATVDGADLHEELRTLAAGWSKPVLIAGYDPGSGEWQEAGRGKRYSHLRVAVQMSNRAGCIEQSQLIAFRDGALQWAGRVQGEAKCLDVAEAHAMAVQLDRFCADVDIAIGINVVTRDGTPFAGARIRALAEEAGLKLEADGVFYRCDELGRAQFTLDNHEPMPFVPEQMKTLLTGGVTFLLDVPRVNNALRAFDVMLGTARAFAAALDGALVDDNRSALSDAAIAKIRNQLEAILAKMEAGQIAAGGPRALRLFS